MWIDLLPYLCFCARRFELEFNDGAYRGKLGTKTRNASQIAANFVTNRWSLLEHTTKSSRVFVNSDLSHPNLSQQKPSVKMGRLAEMQRKLLEVRRCPRNDCPLFDVV